ncbi:hypothetical protein [Lysobacter xanthus]
MDDPAPSLTSTTLATLGTVPMSNAVIGLRQDMACGRHTPFVP